MSTALPGTRSVSSFVASSPSMPGMRTSMITTFGRRRSARATALAHRLRLLCRQVRPAGVQALVLGQQVGPVTREGAEEVLLRARLQVEQIRPHPGGAGGAGGAHDLGEQLGLVAQAGQDRSEPD